MRQGFDKGIIFDALKTSEAQIPNASPFFVERHVYLELSGKNLKGTHRIELN